MFVGGSNKNDFYGLQKDEHHSSIAMVICQVFFLTHYEY